MVWNGGMKIMALNTSTSAWFWQARQARASLHLTHLEWTTIRVVLATFGCILCICVVPTHGSWPEVTKEAFSHLAQEREVRQRSVWLDMSSVLALVQLQLQQQLLLVLPTRAFQERVTIIVAARLRLEVARIARCGPAKLPTSTKTLLTNIQARSCSRTSAAIQHQMKKPQFGAIQLMLKPNG